MKYQTDSNAYSGRFIVLDGIDGCGKSTQLKLLAKHLETMGYIVHQTAEPTTRDLGKILRQYLKDPSTPAMLDALTFAADRIDHCANEIIPEIERGHIVISDRYRDSSYIYQSIQGKNEGLPRDWIIDINKYSLQPIATIIIDIDPKVSLSRKQSQADEVEGELEKFEKMDFQLQIREEFLKIAQENSDGKHYLVDGNQTLEEVTQCILDILIPLLPKK